MTLYWGSLQKNRWERGEGGDAEVIGVFSLSGREQEGGEGEGEPAAEPVARDIDVGIFSSVWIVDYQVLTLQSFIPL